jgi:hypothetical protein
MRQIQEAWWKELTACLGMCGRTRRSDYRNEKTRPSLMQFGSTTRWEWHGGDRLDWAVIRTYLGTLGRVQVNIKHLRYLGV